MILCYFSILLKGFGCTVTVEDTEGEIGKGIMVGVAVGLPVGVGRGVTSRNGTSWSSFTSGSVGGIS
jgi:hypothetical protein